MPRRARQNSDTDNGGKTAVQITGLAGDARDVDQGRVTALAMELDGSVLHPSDEGYADSVLLWNAMITKRPAVVVRAASTDDVVRTVNFARENQIELSIRGGGHNIAGLALSDGGMTLDMSALRDVEVDPDKR